MILLDPRDRRPIYEQIIEKLSELIALGAFSENQPLPSVRSLAAELSINPNTVQRAYVELERRGFIYSVKGKGSFAADPGQARATRLAGVTAELDAALRKAAACGMDEAGITERVRALFRGAASGAERLTSSAAAGQVSFAAGEPALCVAEAPASPAVKAESTQGGADHDQDNGSDQAL